MLALTAGAITNCSKFGEDDGIIGPSTVTGGDGNNTFKWSDGAVGSQRLHVKAGMYTLTVTDGQGLSLKHTFVVRQPRERVAAPNTLGNPPTTRSSARNRFYIDEAPRASVNPPATTAGDYSVSSSGITEAGGNALSVIGDAWHANAFSSNSLTIDNGAINITSGGIQVSNDACLLFGNGTWRLRYEQQMTEMVFEALDDVPCNAAENKKQSQLCTKAKKPSDKRTLLTLVKMKKAYKLWGYKLDDDDDKQRKHIKQQGRCMSKCTMLQDDGTVTPRFNGLQSGNTRPANASADDINACKEAGNAKRSMAMVAKGNCQMHHYEKETFEALLDVLDLKAELQHHWAPDGVNVDVALKCQDMAVDAYCASQLKASGTTDGGKFNFHLSKSDMQTMYKGQLLIAIGFKRVNGDIIVTQVFVLSHEDDLPGQVLAPMVDPKWKDAFANIRFRMDDEEQRKACRAIVLQYIHNLPHHPLNDILFSLDVNRNVSKNHKKELLGFKHIKDALPDNTMMTMASDKNKAVDFQLHRSVTSLGISAKTAVMNNKKKDGTSVSFKFHKSAAPDHHKCDWVLIVYLDKTRTAVEGFSAIRGSEVYNEDGKEDFHWSKEGSRKGVGYRLQQYPPPSLPWLVDLMFEKQGGQQIIL
ncbi:hypothetical protein JKP88DRAFT_243853 [Tribonema minus]|uniref:Uncharacterized protein n=1 Tax=Tribonema minus TaxID=303371 RepID=A0A835ZBT1_9STRA|nr:hypothetical protein JKP88DRAFT_243853 [Tribonema minus]